MGSTSGKTTGGLSAYEQTSDTCAHYSWKGVEGSAKARGGDSGGPAYYVDDGKAYLLYNVSKGTEYIGKTSPCGNEVRTFKNSFGCAAYHLENKGYHAV
jgi:hypothetical protein